jgi:hypothetical protein
LKIAGAFGISPTFTDGADAERRRRTRCRSRVRPWILRARRARHGFDPKLHSPTHSFILIGGYDRRLSQAPSRSTEIDEISLDD